ncbi:hypothetical protein [Streptomyces sp. GQFP]|uniref:hypothetical protein n=1 Tax=Streptomyces sp. GQFP TaxID=2907545 RepID=UPI001F1D51E8|nr:hypothetical protein [Streptomyces sp. GQFP]UIX31981.1 hypothetical protein LUX31_19140 [Streptomyces sp. GQFP]
MLRYATYLEKPHHEQFSLGADPRGLSSVLLSCWFVVTDAQGTTYNMMRGIQAEDMRSSLNFGSYRGTDEFDRNAPAVVPFREHPVVERFLTRSGPESITYEGKGFRLELGDRTADWTEAGGRIRITTELLGDVSSLYVPEQDLSPHPFVFRSYFAKATGTIDGEPVEGLWQMDTIFSRPGLNLREAGWVDHVYQYWLNWLVEYEDGTLEGGHVFRGMPGTDFTPAHHFVDGRSTVRHDATMTFHRTDRGSIDAITLSLGDDLTVEFAQRGSFDWPAHTYGEVASTTRGKTVARSWNYMETFAVNWGDIEALGLAHQKVHGRFPSLQKLLEGAVVRDEHIVWPG